MDAPNLGFLLKHRRSEEKEYAPKRFGLIESLYIYVCIYIPSNTSHGYVDGMVPKGRLYITIFSIYLSLSIYIYICTPLQTGGLTNGGPQIDSGTVSNTF